MTEMVFGTHADKPAEAILSRWWRTIDRWSLGAVFLLIAIGLLLGLAASPPLAAKHGLPPFYFVTRQAFFAMLAGGTILTVSMMSPRAIRRWATLGFVGSFVALAALPWLGTDFGKGAVRWYSLGFASVQPSEFLKPCFAIFAGWLLAASDEPNGPPGRSLSLIMAITLVLLLALQPDFGQAALIVCAWGLMYFVAGAPMWLLMGLAAAVLSAGTWAYNVSEHVARRIDGFLSSEIDPRTQIGYATDAIRQGGVFGVGVGEGEVKRVLPDAHTDFIIAVAAEEYGLILVFAIIALFAVISFRSLVRLTKERDAYIRVAGTGLVVLFSMQAVINMGVAVRLLPAKGMTLPFVSYGGSSLVAIGLTVGAILALTRSRPQEGIGEVLGRRR